MAEQSNLILEDGTDGLFRNVGKKPLTSALRKITEERGSN